MNYINDEDQQPLLNYILQHVEMDEVIDRPAVISFSVDIEPDDISLNVTYLTLEEYEDLDTDELAILCDTLSIYADLQEAGSLLVENHGDDILQKLDLLSDSEFDEHIEVGCPICREGRWELIADLRENIVKEISSSLDDLIGMVFAQLSSPQVMFYDFRVEVRLDDEVATVIVDLPILDAENDLFPLVEYYDISTELSQLIIQKYGKIFNIDDNEQNAKNYLNETVAQKSYSSRIIWFLIEYTGITLEKMEMFLVKDLNPWIGSDHIHLHTASNIQLNTATVFRYIGEVREIIFDFESCCPSSIET